MYNRYEETTSDNLVTFEFHRTGGNPYSEIQVRFDMSQDSSWFDVHNRFIEFLNGCGFIIDSNHPLRSPEELHHGQYPDFIYGPDDDTEIEDADPDSNY